jgi:hypothetical protein
VSHEVTEHIEHAAHEPGHGSGLPRYIGLTIAVIGVLMALCAAQVGEARTDQIATMVESSKALQEHQATSMKYLTLQAHLQSLHALMPDPKVMAETESELKALESEAKDPDAARQLKAARLQTKKVLTTVTPTRDDVLRFTKLIRRRHAESEAAKEWVESYDDAVQVHQQSARYFEYAQIAAEIGIVIASVGLLLSGQRMFARGAWFTAILLGLLSLSVFSGTFVINHQKLHDAEAKIEKAHEHYKGMDTEKNDLKEDEQLMEDIERDIEKLTSGS